jgi:hypothetical protein
MLWTRLTGGMRTRTFQTAVWLVGVMLVSSPAARAGEQRVHGLWVWKTSSVLEAPGSAERLRDFCKSQGITEVYISIPAARTDADEARLVALNGLLQGASIRPEALLGSANADVSGKPREAYLEHVRAIVAFNQKHPKERFEGMHLDIEPHQREENKGAGNLQYLAGLIETYRQVRAIAAPAEMSVNADIANKVLKADAEQRRAMLTSVDRVTLMLYELSSAEDGKATAVKMAKLRKAAERYAQMAYEGIGDAPGVAKMAIGLRTPDYGEELPEMLKSLDEAQPGGAHYLGWARHSYNDWLAK